MIPDIEKSTREEREAYINNHILILGDLEAMIICFFVSVSSLVVAIIHFIISYIHLSKKVKAQG